MSEKESVNPQAMPDVQASQDDRNVHIDKVGVKDVVYPMKLAEKGGGEQSTVASINMYVALPKEKKVAVPEKKNKIPLP